VINETDYFSASVFTKGVGTRVREKANEPSTWINLGEQLGKFHALTKNFYPKHKRQEWYEDLLFCTIPEKVLFGDNAIILEKFNNHINKIKNFPKTKDNYGLIHTDAHFGNMVLSDDGQFTIFDFDDAAYKHMISDIAIIIFYQFAYQNPKIEIRNDRTVWILSNFLKGYTKHNILAREEYMRLNDFMKLRVLALYTVIIASGLEVVNSPWGSNYLKTYRDVIINDEPIIDIDYVLSQIEI